MKILISIFTILFFTTTSWAQGRMSIWTEETRDLKGGLVSKRVDKYSYYPTDSVNEITQEKYKGKKLVSKRKIKHYRNGTRPTVGIITTGILVNKQ